MTWATVEQVQAVTGETVSAADLAKASAMIDTKAGVTEDLPPEAITARDRKILERACCWQAPWVRDHPGLLTEYSAATQTSASGVTDRRESITAILYAPMTMLELRNLSWFGTRTEYIPPRRDPGPVANFLNESSDAYGTWRPL